MRLKERFESVVYFGLGSRRATRTRQFEAPDWLKRLTDRPGPSDPLYLSNRRWYSRLVPWVLIGGAAVLMIAGVQTVASSTKMARHQAQNPGEPQVLPHSLAGPKMEVAELSVQAGKEPVVVGMVKNVSTLAISKGRVTIRLEDGNGGFAGNVEADVASIAPGDTARFRLPLLDPSTRRAMVLQVSAE